MMIADEDATFFGRTHRALTLLKLTIDQQRFNRTSRPHIGASIERVSQDVADQALRRSLPDQLCSSDRVGRQLNVVISEPVECLTHAPKLPKLREYKSDRFTDPLIGIKFDLADSIFCISNRQSFEHFATPCLGLLTCEQSLTDDFEFYDAKCPLNAQVLAGHRDSSNRIPAARQRSGSQISGIPPGDGTSLCRYGITAIPPGCRQFPPLPVRLG